MSQSAVGSKSHMKWRTDTEGRPIGVVDVALSLIVIIVPVVVMSAYFVVHVFEWLSGR